MSITISDTSPRIQYTATSSQTTFSVPFEFFNNADLVVVKTASGTDTTLSYNASPSSATQYSVTGAGTSGGGSITLGGGATAGDVYTIYRDLAIARTTDFSASGSFPVETLNTELDKIIAMAQQLERDLKFSPRAASTTANTYNITFPDLVADKILSVNSSGNGLEFSQSVTNVNTVAGIASDVTTVSGIASNVTTVAGIQANVTTVAGISSNVTTVAGIASDVTTVAGISSAVSSVSSNATNINTVATNISSVNTVASNITDVVAVANDLAEAVSEVETVANDLNEATSEIDTVATNIANVNTVGGISSDVTTVAGIQANVTTVAGISSNVTTVAGISSNVTTVAGMNSNISSVVSNATNINKVAAIDSDVTSVADIDSNVTTVAGVSANVTTVAGISSNVTTVAGISSNVTSVASNSTNINSVAGAISNVNSVGSNISNVNTVASNISGVNSFADRYRVASSAPSSSLDIGDLYFDTTADELKVYKSGGWAAAGSTVNGTSQRYKYTATASQTTFTGSDANGNTLAYDSGYIDVYLNGVHLDPSDYTATSGTSIVLGSGAALNDELYVVAFGTFEVASMNADNLSSGTVPIARLGTSGTKDATTFLRGDNTFAVVDTTNASNLSTGTLPNARLSAVPNSALANSSITINGDTVSLGGTITTGTNWDTTAKTSNFNAAVNDAYFVDTSSNVITATLPASANAGEEIRFLDIAGTFDTNNLTVGRNGHNIQGSASDLTVATERAGFALVYVNATQGWVLKDK